MSSKVKTSNELIEIIDYNIDNLYFDEPIEGSIGTSDIKYKRMNFKTKNENGTVGGLYLKFPQLFCFGVSENTDLMDKNKIIGHSVTHALYSRDGATPEELKTEEVIRGIIRKTVEKIKDLAKNKQCPVKKDNLEVKLKGLENKYLYQKRDDEGEVVDPTFGPTFSAKIVEYAERKDKKTGKITPARVGTSFYHFEEVNNDGEPLELAPFDFLSNKEIKKFFKSESVIYFKDVYMASDKLSLSIQITEANIDPLARESTKLLNKKKKYNRDDSNDDNRLVSSVKLLKIESPKPVSPKKVVEESDGEDEQSDKEEEKVVVPPPVVKEEKKEKTKKKKAKKVESDEE